MGWDALEWVGMRWNALGCVKWGEREGKRMDRGGDSAGKRGGIVYPLTLPYTHLFEVSFCC